MNCNGLFLVFYVSYAHIVKVSNNNDKGTFDIVQMQAKSEARLAMHIEDISTSRYIFSQPIE